MGAGAGEKGPRRFRYGSPGACPVCRTPLPNPPVACTSCGVSLVGQDAWQVLTTLQSADDQLTRMLAGQRIALAFEGEAAAAPALPPAAPAVPVAPAAPELPAPAAPAVPPAPAAPELPAPASTYPPRHDTPVPPRFPGPSQPSAVKPSAVPKILLGLGALCLVVAAIVFLAVAWNVIGVGGRTLVVLGLTGVAAGATAWGALRSLRAAAESFAAVTLGLLSAACFGAREAQWFGNIDHGPFVAVLGCLLFVAGIGLALGARKTPEPVLFTAESGAGLGVLVVLASLPDYEGLSPAGITALAAVIAGLATCLALLLALRITAGIAGALAVLSWCALTLIAVSDHDELSLAAFWGDLEVWPLLAAAALAAVVAVASLAPTTVRVVAASAAVFLAVLAVVMPAFDESRLTLTLVSLGVVAVFLGASYLLRRPWVVVTAAPAVLAGLYLLFMSATLAIATVFWLVSNPAWDTPAGDPVEHGDLLLLDPVLLPAGALGVAAVVLVVRRCAGRLAARPVLVPAAGLALTGTALMPPLYDAPLGLCVALLVIAAGALLLAGLRPGLSVLAGIAFLPAGIAFVASWGNAGLTAAVAVTYAAACVLLEVRGRGVEAARVGAVLLGTLFVCTIAHLAGLAVPWWAFVVIPLLGGAVLLLPSVAREVAAGSAAALVGLVSAVAHGQDGNLVLAGYAAYAATFATVGHLLRPARLHLAWAGLAGFVVAAALSITDPWVNLGLCAVLLVVALGHDLRGPSPELGWAGRVLAPVAAAGALWHVADLVGVDRIWQALPILVVLGAVVLLWPRLEREISAGVVSGIFVLGALGAETGDVPGPLATYLCIAGLVATVSSVIHRGRVQAGWVGLALLVLASLVALAAGWTGVAVLAATTAVALWHDLRTSDRELSFAGAALAPLTAVGLMIRAGDLLDVEPVWTGLVALLVLGVWGVWRTRVEAEVACAVAATWAAMVALGQHIDGGGELQGWLALYLTVAGVALTASALLHPTRRMLSWVGLACFTLAQWLRLSQLGVDTVEAYTLPLALVLLVVGVLALRRTTRGTVSTLGPGLGLALVPTLLHVLFVEPVSWRALVLGVACLALVVAGVTLRWVAPLMAGALVGALVVLRQAEVGTTLPQWLVIGLAGIVLTVVGVTWEKRLADARRAAAYLRALR